MSVNVQPKHPLTRFFISGHSGCYISENQHMDDRDAINSASSQQLPFLFSSIETHLIQTGHKEPTIGRETNDVSWGLEFK